MEDHAVLEVRMHTLSSLSSLLKCFYRFYVFTYAFEVDGINQKICEGPWSTTSWIVAMMSSHSRDLQIKVRRCTDIIPNLDSLPFSHWGVFARKSHHWGEVDLLAKLDSEVALTMTPVVHKGLFEYSHVHVPFSETSYLKYKLIIILNLEQQFVEVKSLVSINPSIGGEKSGTDVNQIWRQIPGSQSPWWWYC